MSGFTSCHCDSEDVDDDEGTRLHIPSTTGFTVLLQDTLASDEGRRKEPRRSGSVPDKLRQGRKEGSSALHGARRNTPFHSGPNSDGFVTFAMSELFGVTCNPSCDCSNEEEEDLSTQQVVAKTFAWKPEDFNLEVATYLQHDDDVLESSAIRCNDVSLDHLSEGDLAPYDLRSRRNSPGDVPGAVQPDLLGDGVEKCSGMMGMNLLTESNHDPMDDFNSNPLYLLDLREKVPQIPAATRVKPSQLDCEPAEASSHKGLVRGDSWVADWSMLAPPPPAEGSAQLPKTWI